MAKRLDSQLQQVLLREVLHDLQVDGIALRDLRVLR